MAMCVQIMVFCVAMVCTLNDFSSVWKEHGVIISSWHKQGKNIVHHTSRLHGSPLERESAHHLLYVNSDGAQEMWGGGDL